MHRQASAVSLPMCFLQRFNYSLLPASRFRIGNRTDGHCTARFRANDTGHQETRQRGKVTVWSFMICTLTKREVQQDEMGGTHRMLEGDEKCIQSAGTLPSRGRTLPRCMASLDFPCLIESLQTLQQAYIKAGH
jgi:hypothetical protein